MAGIRWALIVPAIVLAWCLGVLSGFAIYQAKESLCPPQYVASGTCFAPWSEAVELVAFMAGPAIAAFLIVLLPALLAPSHKWPVAISVYCAGLAFAALIVGLSHFGSIELRGFLAAAIAGAVATVIVHRRLAKFP